MDFDHINPDKKDSNVGRLVWGLTPWDKVLAEIEKCDLVCANCHRLRTYKGGNRPLTHQHTYNLNILISVKKSTPCADCGCTFEPYQMDFDHIDPKTKKADVARLLEEPTEVLLVEVLKCQLVCANCHRVRSHIKKPVCTNDQDLGTKFKVAQESTFFPEDGRKRNRPWTALVGTISISDVSRVAKVSYSTVSAYAKKANITFEKKYSWDSMLGTVPDRHIVKMFGVSATVVLHRRRKLGISPFKKFSSFLPFLGTMIDSEVAEKFSKNPEVVRRTRVRLGIPSYKSRRQEAS
jgi:hypothetical protein